MPSAAYRPREPQETSLWRIVREHLGDFLEHARATYAGPLPKYVKDAFSKYLTCGDFSRGLVRLHCDGCGDEVLVAFSCKQRGVCPSCASRRMSNEAAHITDRVLPNVPLRQWVMSMPMELRALAAQDPKVLRAMNRIFCEEVSRRYRRVCGADSQTGAVACVQRFGGSLNLNVHMHTLFLDGGFVERGESADFIQAPVPTPEQLHALVVRIHARALKWLRKGGYLKANHDPHEPSALQACTQLALSAGTFLQTTEPDAHDVDERKATRSHRFAAQHEGFDVHCGVRIEKNDDEGRERLVRYCTRPVLALDRLAVLPDGNITYRVKYPRRGRTHRTMTPVEFLARTAALVPPPYFPLVRYSGVLGPGAKLRARIVPVPTRTRAKMCPEPEPSPPREKPVKPEKTPRDDSNASLVLASVAREPEPTEWNILTLSHWNRLANGALVAATRTIDWRTLLARTFGFDAMRCPRCAGPLRVMATITDPGVARAILDHVRNARAPPHAA